MACWTRRKPKQTEAERKEELRLAAKRLEKQLLDGRVKMIVSEGGAVAFTGWKDSDGMSDACAYRALSSAGSLALRSAQARAEIAAGRTVDKAVVASGMHSHDGGKTWGRH